MLSCQNLSYSYQDEEYILKDVSLNIPQGQFCFLTGASGAGKSTLLKLLSMECNPTGGHVSLFGTNTNNLLREEKTLVRRKLGRVFQDFQLFNHLTIEENVALPLKVLGVDKKTIRKNVRELLHWIGLKYHRDSYPPVLSGGEKQRVAIARAIINKPDIIFADEPTGNLDPELSVKLMYLFEELNKDGTTVIFATHDHHLVENSDHSVMRLEDGRVSFS